MKDLRWPTKALHVCVYKFDKESLQKKTFFQSTLNMIIQILIVLNFFISLHRLKIFSSFLNNFTWWILMMIANNGKRKSNIKWHSEEEEKKYGKVFTHVWQIFMKFHFFPHLSNFFFTLSHCMCFSFPEIDQNFFFAMITFFLLIFFMLYILFQLNPSHFKWISLFITPSLSLIFRHAIKANHVNWCKDERRRKSGEKINFYGKCEFFFLS